MAKILSRLTSLLAAAMALGIWYCESSTISRICRPCTPPAAFASSKRIRKPLTMPTPQTAMGPGEVRMRTEHHLAIGHPVRGHGRRAIARLRRLPARRRSFLPATGNDQQARQGERRNRVVHGISRPSKSASLRNAPLGTPSRRCRECANRPRARWSPAVSSAVRRRGAALPFPSDRPTSGGPPPSRSPPAIPARSVPTCRSSGRGGAPCLLIRCASQARSR